MVPEGRSITTREVADKLNLRRDIAGDKVYQLVDLKFFVAEGTNQYRRYVRTKKSVDQFCEINLDRESFTWYKDPADFPLRANP
jgi:hypothetical protein